MLTLGAVAYDPKVVTIWDGFREWFARQGLAFDYVLYTTYERQNHALLGGEIDIAWHSPLAWLQTARAAKGKARALAMRDTDRDLTSVILVRRDDPAASPGELDGKRVAVGAADSPQATLIPLGLLAESGVDVDPVRHDVLLGKHGDHIGGEREAVRALLAGSVDAACILDANLLGFGREGVIPTGAVRVLARTDPFDHCNFTTVTASAAHERFTALLLGMSWDDPEVRRLMELEGLKAWLPGRTTGYAALERAMDRFGLV
jgi:phosphonate transport system substrate-binding protein